MGAREHFKIFPAVFIFLIKDNKVFLLRRFNTGWADGQLTAPSGHIEDGETPTVAAVRELREESGTEVDPKDLKFMQVIYRKSDRTYSDFLFITEKWSGEPHNAEPDKADLAGWYDLDNLTENTLPFIKKAFENYRVGEVYTEFGWN